MELRSVEQNDRAQGVAAVERALAILDAWRDGEGALSLAVLAARTGLYKSTLLRLLASLERFRCVQRQNDGQWALGPRLFRWGMLFQGGLALEAAVPPRLAALAAETGESASFWLRQGDQRLCLFRAESPRAIRDDVRPGQLLALIGASGRVLRGEAGIVASFGERDPEMAAIAAPVFGPGGVLAGALSISGPRPRITAAEVALRAACATAAADLTRRLGGDL